MRTSHDRTIVEARSGPIPAQMPVAADRSLAFYHLPRRWGRVGDGVIPSARQIVFAEGLCAAYQGLGCRVFVNAHPTNPSATQINAVAIGEFQSDSSHIAMIGRPIIARLDRSCSGSSL